MAAPSNSKASDPVATLCEMPAHIVTRLGLLDPDLTALSQAYTDGTLKPFAYLATDQTYSIAMAGKGILDEQIEKYLLLKEALFQRNIVNAWHLQHITGMTEEEVAAAAQTFQRRAIKIIHIVAALPEVLAIEADQTFGCKGTWFYLPEYKTILCLAQNHMSKWQAHVLDNQFPAYLNDLQFIAGPDALPQSAKDIVEQKELAVVSAERLLSEGESPGDLLQQLVQDVEDGKEAELPADVMEDIKLGLPLLSLILPAKTDLAGQIQATILALAAKKGISAKPDADLSALLAASVRVKKKRTLTGTANVHYRQKPPRDMAKLLMVPEEEDEDD